MPLAIAIIVFATAWRIMALHLDWPNFSPIMAMAFCGGVYVRNRWAWLVPLLALGLSDLYINHHYATLYGYENSTVAALTRVLCFVAGTGLGCLIARQKSWLKLGCGIFASSLLFYLVTNTTSWAGDSFYPKTLAGWWQALTIGHPEYPPTLFFFRNSLLSDFGFTALFAVTLEYAAVRSGQPSLFTPRSSRPAKSG